jgi:CheY-like chemotaxis protein
MLGDQEDVPTALRLLLKGEGYHPVNVNSPTAALDALEQTIFDAAEFVSPGRFAASTAGLVGPEPGVA